MFTGYHILIKFFNNGNTANDFTKEDYIHFEKNSIEGDLQGITEKLDYLSSLGIDLIYLGPVFESMTTHGYDTTDYFSLSENVSLPEKEKRLNVLNILIEEAHKRNIRVILDIVLNHASKYYNFDSIPEGFKPVTEPPQSRQEERWQKMFIFWNFSDSSTREFLTEVGRYWLKNTNADGFRLDHALGIPQDFWFYFITEMKKIRNDVILLGEVWDDVKDEKDNYNLIKSFKSFEGKNIFTSLFDFFVYDSFEKIFVNKSKNMKEFCEILKMSSDINDEKFSLTYFIENHDLKRFIDICNDKEIWKNVMKLLFTLSGNIMLEYGNEICIKGDKEYIFPSESGRVAMIFPENHTKEQTDCFTFTKDLIKMRKNNEELQSGKYFFREADNDYLIFEKILENRKSVVMIFRKSTEYFFDNTYKSLTDNTVFKGYVNVPEGVYILKCCDEI
ncbi:MAG: hypothetical protein H7A31_03750 [Thermotogae bacterium]|nr:hypothetical protein [Thermotogota bacterium]MCP5465792.1 hypothetical protein [Thermotogota bacterium]